MHRNHWRYPHHHFSKAEKTPLCIPHWKHQLPSCHRSFLHRCPAMTNHNVLKKIYFISQHLLITIKTKEICSQIWSAPFTLCGNTINIFQSSTGLLLSRLPQLQQSCQFLNWWRRTWDENLHPKWHCTIKWSQDRLH